MYVIRMIVIDLELEKPSWGVTGENNEEITRHIMCCQGAPYIDGLTQTIPSTSNSASIVDNHATMTEMEVEISDLHNPVWFSSDAGWAGTTYDDAKAYCESCAIDGVETLHLCPLSAFCPNGPTNTKPLYLQMDAFQGVQWSPISDRFNSWVMVGKADDEDPLTCLTYMQMYNHSPEWGLDGSRPELKKHILCCQDDTSADAVIGGGGDALTDVDDDGIDGSSSTEATLDDTVSTSDAGDTDEVTASAVSLTASEAQIHMWFNGDFGWLGTTYDDAKAYCESITDGTLHLCKLSAYCPNGSIDTKPLYLHLNAFEGSQWAPIGDSFNSWVMVGKLDEDDPMTCVTHMRMFGHNPSWGLDGSRPELKEHILCCQDDTSTDAVNEDGGGAPTYSDGNAIDGSNYDTTADAVNEGAESLVYSDGNADSHEGSVMSNSGKYTLEASVMNIFHPAWFTAGQGGWDGGSHDDAVTFCEQFTGFNGKGMELCPYHAYCPQGPAKPVITGHNADFNEEGEQWAPVYGQSNHWVLIGKRGSNISTTCLSHVQLTGEEPSWGLDGSSREMKKYVLCCSLQ
jgi:hypothetical protein